MAAGPTANFQTRPKGALQHRIAIRQLVVTLRVPPPLRRGRYLCSRRRIQRGSRPMESGKRRPSRDALS